MSSLQPTLAHGQNGTRHINEALDEAVRHDHFTVATLPNAAVHADKIIVVTNGNKGAKCLAYSDGTSWLVIALGAAVSAT
ncbi:hypothetical protein [Bradyrhizobium sp. SZCCHNRI2010]|uniref:hypothetical protein n=1 Tax=Bradyrhizobium sp. SZCCHNRI2010 TaxID=3057283 RepID=UPI0028EDC1DB|nr:hypothetical protein [Bradyrhizobium sp. SZCCHNRI2010]